MQQELEAALQSLPFWDHLTAGEMEEARRGARIVRYQRGALVHGCNGQCLGLIAVRSGKLRAYMLSEDGREIALYRLMAGDACVLAASCVIRQITFDVHMVADADTELLIVNASTFKRLAQSNVYVECCQYKLATERFSDVMWSMQQLLFISFDKRLAQYLWEESDHARQPIRATHEQMARDTGAARETVTRMLRNFAEDGIVRLGRGTVTVVDAEKLKKLALM
ncbi:MAG: Crp/Fnr family transcriptional regulator [Oscillospiraceae bacterium]|nr:Crp/Fnr family transcriptional regulator [Oscillospiraceae bacterium]